MEERTNNNISEPTLPPRRAARRFIVSGAVLGIIAFAFYAGYQKGAYGKAMTDVPVSPNRAVFQNASNDDQDTTIDFALFWKVWNLLGDKYVEKDTLDAKKLFYGAIDGMLAATGDPYTTFFDPQENKEFKEDLEQSFDGIGAEMQIKDGILTVVAPLENSPAQKAGILAGDKILKIDGESTENIGLNEAVAKIRGPRGTAVTLSVFHSDEDAIREITVQRDEIVVKSVLLEIRDGIAVIQLTKFGAETTAEFKVAAQEVQRQGARGILIDVRNNSGGFLDAAVDLAGYFLPSGSVVVIEEDAEKRRRELKTRGSNQLGGVPIVVLTNQGSASASEILAAALRENRKDVLLVGETSYGKGSVQELIPTSSTTSVKITVARWLTPDGHQINNEGIKPDEEVKLTRDDFEAGRDPQFDRAWELLRKKL
ncbi:MAG: S41 family peptidase [Candidatus Moraniibacteriota bacterium]|nr:MAG: S41 family peptidase [Candidatus Moranbacteria bacterium]